ncbi:PP2C family protein-serine/threonine phosphatase [Spirosoma foliorum]|uniref:Serine/threonine-protein phosphatase n=1 Tax=Spirosoma foliorum TaxID=2710596 RepID=A0A7G5GZ96_9BACT|nr:protein phosphatase 2C domain-containing protein [Spirosoma foliorum]QMW04188.1 serine/threonine-protein phosphatase [Spirosoma foliorum]
MNSIQIAGQTDVGQRRTDNQDTFVCSMIWDNASALLVVIDGVGGYAGGDRAAAIAKESIEQYMATPTGKPLSMLREAVVFANNRINDQRQEDPRLAQMCCVLTAVVVDDRSHKLSFVHVGDTRLYRYRQGTLEKLTHDHSMVGIREDANELTEAEAMQHPRRNEILREVGSAEHRVDDPDFLESDETDFLPGDQLLLCSDGLTDMITQAQIKTVLDRGVPLEKQIAELIRIANEQGGKDNITVVLARNTKTQSSPTPAKKAVEVPALPQQSVPIVDVTPEPVTEKPQVKKRSLTGLWSVLGLLVGGLIAVIAWYQFQPSRQADVTTTDSLSAISTEPGATSIVTEAMSRFDSLLQAAHRSKDHRLILPADTFRLNTPLLLTDSLLSVLGDKKLTVFMPADTLRAQVALRITRVGPVRLENIVIAGFKTGIETTPKTKLQLANVSFRNVALPIGAVIRQDTFRNAVIEISVKNQPDSSKRVHP